MDKKYWQNYYKRNQFVTEPSCFAKHVMDNYIHPGGKLLEIGCGSGRDSIYFAKNGINVYAIDQCKNVEQIFDDYNKTHSKQIKFQCADFTKLKLKEQFDAIYSRFTLHAIKDNEEDNVLKWASVALNDKGKLYIEARSTKNELFKKGIMVDNEENTYIYNDHKRRFLNKEAFCSKLKKYGFSILMVKEESGFAPTQNDDQVFMRIIAQKR